MTAYDAVYPVARECLCALRDILTLAAGAPNAAELPAARIHADMLPLTMQVHIACAHANRLAARTANSQHPQYDADLATFEDMQARIAHAIGLLDAADRTVVDKNLATMTPFDGPDGKPVDITMHAYAHSYTLPNMFFHVVTAYNIARKEGVPLGKMDYLGPFLNQHTNPKIE